MRLIRYLVIVCMAVFAFSCMKDAPSDFNNPESVWNPGFSFPVGYTSLSMNAESGFDTLMLLTNPATGEPYWVDFDLELRFILPFDMQEIDRFSEEIISILFRINTYNGFPAVASGQVSFLDADSNLVETMFNPALSLEAGALVGNGETVNATHSQTDVIFGQSSIDALKTVRYVLVEGALSNIKLDNNLINYYPGYKLDIQIGVQVELNMSL